MVRVLAIHLLPVNLKEYADPNWESNITCTMSDQRIPRPYKKMQTLFEFTKNIWKICFFCASDFGLTWFTKKGISDTISFYPNQIKFESPSIKENKGLTYLFFDEISFGFFPENLHLNHFVHLNTMSVTIFDNKFVENLEWLDIKTTFGIPITSYYFIDDNIGAWYEYIERQNIWNNIKLWTFKRWVVWIVLKLLLNLVAEKIISTRNSIKNSIKKNTKGKEKLVVPN